jgi:tetratricopeptide (TPR) repeat protein
MKPRIFISTVSSELRSIRQLTANVLQRLGYEPVWQDIFNTEPGDLRQVLRDKIDDCEGLIQIVGRAYGAEPPQPDPEFGRVSYTQYEFLHARRREKKTWVVFAEDGCTRDQPLEQLDLPRDADSEHPDPAGYQAEHRALQDAWRRRLRADVHLWHGAGSDTELELKLERLKDELAALRRGFRRWQRLVAGLSLAALILIGCLFLVQWRAKQTTEAGLKHLGGQVKQVIEGQTVTAARIRLHLVEASEHARDAALAEADREPRFDERERLCQQANKAHEIRLGRINELAAGFVALERQADTSPVLREMIRILNGEKTNPVDKAIAYAEGQRPALLERVRARKLAEQERNRSDLEPLLKLASLEQTRGRPDAARARFQEVFDLEPAWPPALESYAWFLNDQSVQSQDHGSLQSALADAELLSDLAVRLNSDGPSTPQRQRTLLAAWNQLGDLLMLRGRPGDAEMALNDYRRSLELAEALLKRSPDSEKAARDVSVALLGLGYFLAARAQPGDTEQALNHYARSLEIHENLLKRNPSSAEAARDLMASLNRLGVFLAQRGQPGDADQALKHYTRGLEMAEDLLKRNPDSAQAARDAWRSSSSLGDFLAQRGQPGDADQALKHYVRDVEICEDLLKRNPDSPQAARDVSASLATLGDFLARRRYQGDTEQALKHFTRSVKISEDSLRRNPDSARDVRAAAISLGMLGDFLVRRGQLGDAEEALKFFTRCLEVNQGLLKRNPDSAQAARDVSVSLMKLGDSFNQRGQPGDAERALEHYTRSLDILQELLKRNPDSAQAARDVSVSLDSLGVFLAGRGQLGDAEAALNRYRRSLDIREALAKRDPDSTQAARDVAFSHSKLGELYANLRKFESAVGCFRAGITVLDGMIAKGMNPESATRERAILEWNLGLSLASLATGDWDAITAIDRALLPAVLTLRANALAQQGRLVEVAQAATTLRELDPKTETNLYNAACAYGLCAALAVKDKPALTPGEQAEHKKYIDLAMACLKEAIAAGFKNFDHMQQDSNLAVLRGLPEFQDLIPKPAGK